MPDQEQPPTEPPSTPLPQPVPEPPPADQSWLQMEAIRNSQSIDIETREQPHT